MIKPNNIPGKSAPAEENLKNNKPIPTRIPMCGWNKCFKKEENHNDAKPF
jgi:hypothetical protein